MGLSSSSWQTELQENIFVCNTTNDVGKYYPKQHHPSKDRQILPDFLCCDCYQDFSVDGRMMAMVGNFSQWEESAYEICFSARYKRNVVH